MSTTERLRQLLDERGVEHTDHENNATWWSDGNVECAYIQSMSDRLGQLSFMATPEQAVEATLGRGTCRMERVEDEQRILHGWLECSECGPVYPPVNDRIAKAVAFCPFCGAKVVGPTTNDVGGEAGE